MLLHLGLVSYLLASVHGFTVPDTVRVAIIGAGGYIGSRLHEHLELKGMAVTGYDRSTRLVASAGKLTFKSPVAAHEIPDQELRGFDVVIFLGGLTGRVACDTARSTATVHQQNVEEPVNLAKRMQPNQLLIFASTSAIAEGSGSVPMREDGHEGGEGEGEGEGGDADTRCYMQRYPDLVNAFCPSYPTCTDAQLYNARCHYVNHGRTEGRSFHCAYVQTALLDSYSTSMHNREKEMARLSSAGLLGTLGLSKTSVPKLVGLRFGTVLGVSRGQRTDLGPMALVKSAFTTGVLRVSHPETSRGYLWLEDQIEAFAALIERFRSSRVGGAPSSFPRFAIYNLVSFNSNVASLAAAVAARTGARMETVEHRPAKDSVGFSLDGSKFAATFGFTPRGDLAAAVNDLVAHAPESITAKGVHYKSDVSIMPKAGSNQEHAHEHGADGLVSIPCPVCGSHNLQLTLDLHKQPLANDFFNTTHEALSCERHPLQLVRCRTCNHLHLSQLVSRKRLFSDYLYVSGTSATLQKYFEWLAAHIAAAVDRVSRHAAGKERRVLELACNDGSQLDQFKKLGWRTYGVDPAANIVPTAVAKGHKVKVGFWGAENVWPPEDEPAIELDAIVAQNVFAHVPSPVTFLRDCAKAMGKHTLLYIQTSQCHMHEDGQFDTAYHEHLSFFTAHSFRKAADLAGLNITGWKVTPIHGQSCLVTMMKLRGGSQSSLHRALQPRLQEEVRLGLTEDFFYERYKARGGVTASWIEKQLVQLQSAGYRLGGYGAAAKGMVLLHFLLGRGPMGSRLEFVIDDAPMKQGTYCPGTTIPVKPISHIQSLLASDPHTPLAVVVFAWNFWSEIALRLRESIEGSGGNPANVIAILPFPTSRVVTLAGEVLANVTYQPAELSAAPITDTLPAPAGSSKRHGMPRRRVMLISHVYNEAMILPFWIAHHAPLFDHAVIIDYDSTDGSADIIRRLAPPSWKVVRSRTGKEFGAADCDAQVREQEKLFPTDWHLALTAAEFLIHPRFRETLASLQTESTMRRTIRALPMLRMVGDDTRGALRRFESLPLQRSMYLWNSTWDASGFADGHHFPWRRYLHTGFSYGSMTLLSVGRHTVLPEYEAEVVPHRGGFVIKYVWTPWPESIERKMQIGRNIPENDVKLRLGWQHIDNMQYETLDARRVGLLQEPGIRVHDLREVLAVSNGASPELVALHTLYREMLDPLAPLYSPSATSTKRGKARKSTTTPTNFRDALVPFSSTADGKPTVLCCGIPGGPLILNRSNA